MIPLPEWHPIAVHFPLALTVTGALALSAARVLPSERHGATLAVVGTWNLCLGALGALLALGTGLAAVGESRAGAAGASGGGAARQMGDLHDCGARVACRVARRGSGSASRVPPARFW